MPYLRPEGEKIDLWSLIGKFVGQDITKISLPVILSEPLTTLQRCAETINVREDYILEACVIDNDEDRFLKIVQHNLSQYLCAVFRTKKPFNPMLGETYELVTDTFKFLSEQVSHHPPVSAYF